MDVRELRAKALHYRRVAGLVSDDAMAAALNELAEECASLADRLEKESERPPGAAEQ